MVNTLSHLRETRGAMVDHVASPDFPVEKVWQAATTCMLALVTIEGHVDEQAVLLVDLQTAFDILK